MKSTGIVRKVDELGRIVLPIELRRALDIEEKDQIEFRLEGDHLTLRKFENTCLFCASTHELVNYMGKNVCAQCICKLNKM